MGVPVWGQLSPPSRVFSVTWPDSPPSFVGGLAVLAQYSEEQEGEMDKREEKCTYK